jgi:acid phosphatase class B
MPQLNDDFLAQWESIVAGVNKTDVPLECIKKIIIKFHGRQQQTINLHTLRKQGLDYEDIENMLTRTINELDDKIRDIDFVVDISAVAEMVQPETDKLLKKL